jgi:hypothetical protein
MTKVLNDIADNLGNYVGLSRREPRLNHQGTKAQKILFRAFVPWWLKKFAHRFGWRGVSLSD